MTNQQKLTDALFNETAYADIIDLTFYMEYQTIMLL